MKQRKKKPLSWDQFENIVKKYDEGRLVVSRAYLDGGLDLRWPRFERAVGNQIEDGEATVARYAIWANTVRDHIIEAMRLMDEKGQPEEARRLLIAAANSLSAFSDVQTYFDPFGLGEVK